jgi:hypothetical protein
MSSQVTVCGRLITMCRRHMYTFHGALKQTPYKIVTKMCYWVDLQEKQVLPGGRHTQSEGF